MRRLLLAALLLAPGTALGFSFGDTIGTGDPWTAANAAQIQTFLTAIDDCAAGEAVTGNGANVTPSICIDFLTPTEGNAAYQPLDADLTSISALTTTAFGRDFLTTPDIGAAQLKLSLIPGATVQAFDSDLASIAALLTTAHGRGLLDDADPAASRSTIGAVGLTGNETIGGNKTFSGDVTVTGALTKTCDPGTQDCSETKPIEPTATANPAAGNVTVRYLANAIVLRDSAGTETPLGASTGLADPGVNGIVERTGAGTTAALASTGTGNVVRASSPTLVTPNLGTPSAATLTNATGLPISTGVSGLGTGVGTFLGTPSSANLASAVTGETGTGALVFGTSPVFATMVTLPTAAAPTTTADGQCAFDLDAWATGRDALECWDGTASTYLLGVQAADVPAAGQIPKWNADGTITWEPDATGGGASTFSVAGDSGTPQSITDTNTLTIIGGDGITTTAGATDNLTVAVDNTVSRTIASGTAALGTAAIASAACATTVTVAAAGVLTTDAISWTPNADISTVTGYTPATTGGLTIYPFPTAGNVSFKVCNPSSASITPGAVTLNWRVVR